MSSSVVDEMKDGSLIKFLDFYLEESHESGMRLGVNIQKIREVVECNLSQMQKLPDSYLPFITIYDLRHVPVPVIDLEQFFHLKSSTKSLKKIIICEFQKMLIGFVVSRTGRIHTIKNSEVLPVPAALDFSSKRLFNGIYKDKESFVNFLDIELILDSLNINIASASETKILPSFQGKKVLLVEDSKLFQQKLKTFFSNLGISIVTADNGQEGLEKLMAHRYDFDVIFTDIEMPILNGIGMVRKIKSIPEARSIPVIFNTSISNKGLIEDIQRDKLGDYFIKYDEEEIHSTLISILNKCA